MGRTWTIRRGNRGGVLLATLLACSAAQAGAAPSAGAAVVLNEINCEGTDWVELVNTSAADADVSGWLLTDDPLGSIRTDHRMLFAAGATIPANDDLVIEKGAAGFPFGISCGNDTIRLADATETLVDEFTVPSLAGAGDTWGRFPNGTGPWVETKLSQGAPNEPADLPGPGGDPAAWMFEPDAVVEIDLGLSPVAIDALDADPDEYVEGTFSLSTTGGSYGPLTVGIRLKGGAGSFRTLAGKAAFKVKFNEFVGGQRFFSLKKLTLNNMVQDKSEIHEVLAYEAFRAAGVPAPRAGYAVVSVNGADYGLHLNLETPDDVWLPGWFASTQHLYEGGLDDDVRPADVGLYEVDEGSESNVSDLESFAAAVQAPAPGFSDRLAGVADLHEMTTMWAVEHYIGHWDGYSAGDHTNNYFLHSDAGGLFEMLPWGTDQTWVQHVTFDRSVSELFSRCLADAACAAMYRQAVIDVRAQISALGLDVLATTTAAALAPWQAADTRREHDPEDIATAVAETQAFLSARPGEAELWLQGIGAVPPPIAGTGIAGTKAVGPRLAKRRRCKRFARPRRHACLRKLARATLR